MFVLFTIVLLYSMYTRLYCEVTVIGSKQKITATEGQDVILPCHLNPTFNVQGLTVEWSNPDLKPDPSDRLSRVKYVHLYRDQQEVPDMKMASYFRRTSLFVDALKQGNISLKILNVSQEDSGRYKCFVPKLQSRVKSAIVELVVHPKMLNVTTLYTLLQIQNQTDTFTNKTKTTKRSRIFVLVPIVLFVSFFAILICTSKWRERNATNRLAANVI